VLGEPRWIDACGGHRHVSRRSHSGRAHFTRGSAPRSAEAATMVNVLQCNRSKITFVLPHDRRAPRLRHPAPARLTGSGPVLGARLIGRTGRASRVGESAVDVDFCARSPRRPQVCDVQRLTAWSFRRWLAGCWTSARDRRSRSFSAWSSHSTRRRP
jgi:hypothetical protein